ncbi:MATE family efflux transporter [Salidesulfovibrio brasiliensis]|uniref:MATE family efflux transporter n=1 Tax=Salidesulfovibrio brasiliensis TaxID=221711 RepID=UPI0006D15851|nr:MATE family efflux transporter [Salidesulfovibrio brasiliensis]
MNNTGDLTTGSIPRHIRNLAIPASIGLFFNTMYNVVDTWFAGRIGTEAQAALSLSLPVFFLVIALGSGISVGSTALIGEALGAKERDKAAFLSIQAVAFGVMIGLLLVLFGPMMARPLFGFMGASEAYLDTCMEYMTPIFIGAPLFLMVYMFNAILQAAGDTRPYRNFLILGAGLNCILDPWYIFGGFGMPAMGVAGVAWATVTVQGVGVVYLGYKARKTGLLKTGRGRNLIPSPIHFAQIAGQGFPASVNFLTIGIGMFVINHFVSDFGKSAVAAYGVAMRVEQVALMPSIGLNVAALAMAAQNHGAKHYERIRESMHRSIKYGAMLTLPAAVPILLFAAPFMRFFSNDPDVVRIGAEYLRIDALALFGYVIIFVCTSSLQGMKKPLFAVWLGAWRQAAAPAFLFWLLTRHLSFDISAIWWSVLGIVWTSAAIAWVYAERTLAKRLA